MIITNQIKPINWVVKPDEGIPEETPEKITEGILGEILRGIAGELPRRVP